MPDTFDKLKSAAQEMRTEGTAAIGWYGRNKSWLLPVLGLVIGFILGKVI